MTRASTATNLPEPGRYATIAKLAPREKRRTAYPEMPAGVYRVIHGRLVLPLPEDKWIRDPDTGAVLQKQTEATIHVAKRNAKGEPIEWVGDQVSIPTSDEASRLCAQNILEPLDASPSRCGKVCQPKKPTKNFWRQVEQQDQV
jgi:hypothetical protein